MWFSCVECQGFQCGDGTCRNYHAKCDGYRECDDSSDESVCPDTCTWMILYLCQNVESSILICSFITINMINSPSNLFVCMSLCITSNCIANCACN